MPSFAMLPIQETASSLRTFACGVLEQNLRGQKEILEQQGYTVKTRVVQCLAKNEINRIAVEENYSVMVVSARTHTMTSEVFGGIGLRLNSSCTKTRFNHKIRR